MLPVMVIAAPPGAPLVVSIVLPRLTRTLSLMVTGAPEVVMSAPRVVVAPEPVMVTLAVFPPATVLIAVATLILPAPAQKRSASDHCPTVGAPATVIVPAWVPEPKTISLKPFWSWSRLAVSMFSAPPTLPAPPTLIGVATREGLKMTEPVLLTAAPRSTSLALPVAPATKVILPEPAAMVLFTVTVVPASRVTGPLFVVMAAPVVIAAAASTFTPVTPEVLIVPVAPVVKLFDVTVSPLRAFTPPTAVLRLTSAVPVSIVSPSTPAVVAFTVLPKVTVPSAPPSTVLMERVLPRTTGPVRFTLPAPEVWMFPFKVMPAAVRFTSLMPPMGAVPMAPTVMVPVPALIVTSSSESPWMLEMLIVPEPEVAVRSDPLERVMPPPLKARLVPAVKVVRFPFVMAKVPPPAL